LALRFYGDAELYRLIATASWIADPDVIDVGQRLIFPDFTRYTVVAGDPPCRTHVAGLTPHRTNHPDPIEIRWR
jgi:LysM repeat protein